MAASVREVIGAVGDKLGSAEDLLLVSLSSAGGESSSSSYGLINDWWLYGIRCHTNEYIANELKCLFCELTGCKWLQPPFDPRADQHVLTSLGIMLCVMLAYQMDGFQNLLYLFHISIW